MNDIPHVPVSWGELLDKIAILEIKRERIASRAAQANVAHELGLLEQIATPVVARVDLTDLIGDLRDVNAALWEIEDAIRVEDRAGRFGEEFIALARSVYQRNDERAAIKRAINARLGSALVEEKSYADHGRQAQAAE